MRALVQMIVIQECFYGAFLVVLGLIIGMQHGWEGGVKTFLYALFFFQFIIAWINRKAIRAAFFSDIKDEKRG